MTMVSLEELAAQYARTGSAVGGVRPGSGRKPKAKPPVEDVPSIDDLLGDGPAASSYDGDHGGVDMAIPVNANEIYNGAKARKEAALAMQAELAYRIKEGSYIPRDAVRQQTATAFQAIVQTIRAIPDNLERRKGISPDVSEAVGELLDAALNDLADELERIYTETYEDTSKS